MIIRRFLTLVMAGFLTLGSLAAGPTVLGVAVAANRVHLNTTTVTTGATVYDGDRFFTEAGGLLRVQSGPAILELAEASAACVRKQAKGAQGLEAELGKGTLAFSAVRADSLNVIALGANIRPAADTRTVARITVTGPRELRISARRGALQFSYRGETETLAEGRCYGVLLDSPEENSKKDGHLAPIRWPKAFKIVIIGEAAAVVALGIYEWRESVSPDRP
jgi:hypothetical protein